MHWGNYGWGMGFGGIFMALFWILIIGGTVYAVATATRSTKEARSHETPLEIARKRYARGEINKEEFDRLRDELKRS